MPFLSWITRSVHTEIVVDAPVDRVWEILADFQSYDQWNPFILRGDGRAEEGRLVPITIQLPGQKPGPYRVRILECRPPQRLVWLGHFKLPGLCNGRHLFELESVQGGQTRLIHAELFQGILVPFIWPMLGPRFLQAFSMVNQAVKVRAETV